MLYYGTQSGYHWIETDSLRMKEFINVCQERLAGKHLVITSYDRGPLIPSVEQKEIGWRGNYGFMYSPSIDSRLEIPHDGYDEWYFFTKALDQPLPELTIFVEVDGFRLHDLKSQSVESDPRTMADYSEFFNLINEQQDHFWDQLNRFGAESYVSYGDHFIFASQDINLYNCVKKQIE